MNIGRTLPILAVLIIFALFTACHDDPVGPPITKSASHIIVEWEQPFPVATISEIWGSSADNVYAVGSYSQIFHYDGIEWSEMDSPVTNHLDDVIGIQNDNIVAVGTEGTILRFDGTKWRREESGTTVFLFGVWGCAHDTCYAVGRSGTVLSFDGSAWSTLPTPTDSDLFCIWGSSGKNIYVGARDALWHYDGATWTDMEIQVRIRVIGIWGSSSNDIWATDGTNWLWHYDGIEWKTIITGVNYPFMNFWGFSFDNIFASGWDGLVAQYDGNTWSGHSMGEHHLTGIWGSSDMDVWVTGSSPRIQAGCLFHFDGVEWTQWGRFAEIYGLQDIWSDKTGDRAVAVGHTGMIAQKVNDIWEVVPALSRTYWNTVWGAPSGEVFVGSTSGVMAHFDGAVWSLSPDPPAASLTDIWGTSNDNVYMSSYSGLWHYDGTGWDTTPVKGFLKGVWGTSETNVYVAGGDTSLASGIVKRFDGVHWEIIFLSTEDFVTSITGIGMDDLLIHTSNINTRIEKLLRYKNSSWQDVTPPQVSYFDAIGGNRRIGFVVQGHNEENNQLVDQVLIRLNNGLWEEIDSRYRPDFRGIWGGLDNGVYLVGGSDIARREMK